VYSINIPNFLRSRLRVSEARSLNSTAENADPLTLHLSCVSGGYTIPAGVDIMIPIYYVIVSPSISPIQ
jgi:hypothetical protein